MGQIATNKNKITLYYHSDSSIGKQALAYVKSSEKEVLTIDIAKTDVPGTHWVEMAGHLGLRVVDLIDGEHPDFVKQYGDDDVNLEEHDWLKLLEKSPQLLTYPIVIIGEKFIQVENPSVITKYFENDSAGIDE